MVNEIRILRRVKDPAIINLCDVYESEQYVHLVFERIKNTQLFSTLKEKEDYSERDAQNIMKSLLQAVASLHSRNIIHRDLKPESIMLAYSFINSNTGREIIS